MMAFVWAHCRAWLDYAPLDVHTHASLFPYQLLNLGASSSLLSYLRLHLLNGVREILLKLNQSFVLEVLHVR